MKRFSQLVLALLVASMAWAGCVPETSSTPLSASHGLAIQDSVANALGRFRDHSATATWDSVLALYSTHPDFRFFENGRLQYGSVGDIEAALAGLPPGMDVRTEYRDTEIQALGPGMALVNTLFESTFGDLAAGGFQFGGAVTMLWVHEPEGWRIRSGHSSAPVPRGGQ